MTDTGGTVELDYDTRRFVEGLHGRRIAWLSTEGVDQTTLLANVLEVPRVPWTLALGMGLGETHSVVAAALSAQLGMDIVEVVRWPAVPVGLPYGPFPESVGMVFVLPQLGRDV